MMINERRAADTDTGTRELRVKVPEDLYQKLHILKLLKGIAIRDAVQAALHDYLRERESARRAPASRRPQ